MLNNKKGFTLIEALGTIVIIGIVSTIAIVAVNRYLKDSKQKSYKMISQAVYEAATNCMIDGNCSVGGTYQTSYLLNQKYLKSLKNPNSSREDCNGEVTIQTVGTSSTEYQKYKYIVDLECKGITNGREKITWPEDVIKEGE